MLDKEGFQYSINKEEVNTDRRSSSCCGCCREEDKEVIVTITTIKIK